MPTQTLRSRSLTAPGGDRYEWQQAETKFTTPADGKYSIAITASAKNAAQNQSTDDDLRVQLDSYDFGKYEVHQEKVSYQGFGTASAFDGTTLKGGTQTIYYIVELNKGEHTLKFFADETPTLKKIELTQLQAGEKLEIEFTKPPENISSERKGIPYLSFIFLGVKPKDLYISSLCQSASQKKTTDGDNLKVIVNGKIILNQKAPTSDKYRNFYFSGDLNQGQSETLKIDQKEFEFLEDSVELWYDETPSVLVSAKIYDDIKTWLAMAEEEIQNNYFIGVANATLLAFKILNWNYAAELLSNALNAIPEKKVYKKDDKIIKVIKEDSAYQKILLIIKTQIQNGVLDGQVNLGDKEKQLDVQFEDVAELKYCLHGIHKIIFKAEKKEDDYKVNFTIFDIYDYGELEFKWEEFYKFPMVLVNNEIDQAEKHLIVKNFEIEINLQDIISFKK
jgi:hypothetical protein